MTSRGFVIAAATPPAIPPHNKYHKTGFYLSLGLKETFRFSLTVTTVLAYGMFIN
jgi:hypothetical protein